MEDERTPAAFPPSFIHSFINLNTDLQLRSGTVGSHTAVSSGPCSVSSDQNHPAEKVSENAVSRRDRGIVGYPSDRRGDIMEAGPGWRGCGRLIRR